jgi:flagellar protein FliO/FliZ
MFFDIVKMVVALAFILGLIYGVVFLLKRLLPGASNAAAERISLQVLGQLGMGSRQRVAVIRVQDKTLVIGITEGSINTLAELTPSQAAVQKEADEPKIFNDLLAWRKDANPARPASSSGAAAAAAQHGEEPRADDRLSFRPFAAETAHPRAADDRGEGPQLFSPGERPSR